MKDKFTPIKLTSRQKQMTGMIYLGDIFPSQPRIPEDCEIKWFSVQSTARSLHPHFHSRFVHHELIPATWRYIFFL